MSWCEAIEKWTKYNNSDNYIISCSYCSDVLFVNNCHHTRCEVKSYMIFYQNMWDHGWFWTTWSSKILFVYNLFSATWSCKTVHYLCSKFTKDHARNKKKFFHDKDLAWSLLILSNVIMQDSMLSLFQIHGRSCKKQWKILAWSWTEIMQDLA